jgi:antitoxin (DNA-binding transcriptional repressor) of toxin-antitoxin stability system
MSRRVTVSELRDDLDGVLARVACGERVTLVDGDRAVADLGPAAGARTLERMISEGQVTPPTRVATDFAPLVLAAGPMTLSEALSGVRG